MKSPIKYLKLILLVSLIGSRAQAQLPCENDTSYLRALIDLQEGYYLGYQGGLYADGSNEMPYPHFSAGMNISRQVVPLNAEGVLDVADGKVGFICLGASTAGNAFNHFKSVAEDDPAVNPCLRFANCAVGAKGLEIMLDTVVNGWYWDDEVLPDVESADITRFQVQIIWMMVTSRVDTILVWPFQPQEVANKYEQLMPVLLAKFPNLKQVYVSGFNYGGYADPEKEFYDMIVEPSSYWNNWSVKFLVERQIDGDPDLKFTEPDRMAPWIGWGPHIWADGTRANQVDKLRWVCEADYKPDGGGYHLSNSGKDKVGKLIYNFFKGSEVAADWFLYGARWVSCDPDMRAAAQSAQPQLTVQPNPAGDRTVLILDGWSDGEARIRVYNAAGEEQLHSTTILSAGYAALPVSTHSWAPGIYLIRVELSDGSITTGKLLKQ